MIPAHLRYTSEHEWAVVTENGTVKFGITDHAQGSLGDIVFVSLPTVGTTITAGESCGEIESTKSVAEIYAPVSGTVVAANDVVETAPETVNDDPYGLGWLVEVEPADASETKGLLSADEYGKLINDA